MVSIIIRWINSLLFVGSLKKFRGIKAGDLAQSMIKIASLEGEQLIFESDELLKIAKIQ